MTAFTKLKETLEIVVDLAHFIDIHIVSIFKNASTKFWAGIFTQVQIWQNIWKVEKMTSTTGFCCWYIFAHAEKLDDLGKKKADTILKIFEKTDDLLWGQNQAKIYADHRIL